MLPRASVGIDAVAKGAARAAKVQPGGRGKTRKSAGAPGAGRAGCAPCARAVADVTQHVSVAHVEDESTYDTLQQALPLVVPAGCRRLLLTFLPDEAQHTSPRVANAVPSAAQQAAVPLVALAVAAASNAAAAAAPLAAASVSEAAHAPVPPAPAAVSAVIVDTPEAEERGSCEPQPAAAAPVSAPLALDAPPAAPHAAFHHPQHLQEAEEQQQQQQQQHQQRVKSKLRATSAAWYPSHSSTLPSADSDAASAPSAAAAATFDGDDAASVAGCSGAAHFTPQHGAPSYPPAGAYGVPHGAMVPMHMPWAYPLPPAPYHAPHPGTFMGPPMPWGDPFMHGAMPPPPLAYAPQAGPPPLQPPPALPPFGFPPCGDACAPYCGSLPPLTPAGSDASALHWAQHLPSSAASQSDVASVAGGFSGSVGGAAAADTVTVSAHSAVKDAAGAVAKVLERRGSCLLLALRRRGESDAECSHVAAKTLAVSRFYVNTITAGVARHLQGEAAAAGEMQEVTFVPFSRSGGGSSGGAADGAFGFLVVRTSPAMLDAPLAPARHQSAQLPLPVPAVASAAATDAADAPPAVVLKAAAGTDVQRLSNALVHHVLERGRCVLQLAGAGACLTALRALERARGRLASRFRTGLAAAAAFSTEDTTCALGRATVFLRIDVVRCALGVVEAAVGDLMGGWGGEEGGSEAAYALA